MSSASTSESSIASWKAETSSSEYWRGRQARGLWLKIWIALQARSTPRATALAGPPAGETCAPINMNSDQWICVDSGRSSSVACCVHARALRSFSDRSAPYRWSADGTVQLAPGAGAGRGGVRPADRGHRPRALDARERGADLRGAALARARLGR